MTIAVYIIKNLNRNAYLLSFYTVKHRLHRPTQPSHPSCPTFYHMLLIILLIPSLANESRRSKVFIRACVCLSALCTIEPYCWLFIIWLLLLVLVVTRWSFVTHANLEHIHEQFIHYIISTLQPATASIQTFTLHRNCLVPHPWPFAGIYHLDI